MCGIFGMAFQKGHSMTNSEEVKYILDNLLTESEIRGRDASGVAFISLRKVVVAKRQMTASKLIETDFYKESARRCLHMSDNIGLTTGDAAFDRPIIILGHTRFKTKGTPRNHHNNHPIVSNKVVGVHNGIIDNDDTLFKRFTKKFPPSFIRRAEVDSEIIFRLLDHYTNTIDHSMSRSIKAATRILEGNYACAAVNTRSPHMLWLFKCIMPIEIRHYPIRGLIIFASSSKFIEAAVDGVISEKGIDVDLKNNSGIGINLYQNRQTMFDIPTEGANIQSHYNQNWKG